MLHCLQQDFFITIGQLADELGLETYVVGGFVRDCLLGREVKDVDFVVIGNGIDLAEAVSKKIPGTTPVYVYQNFGTAGLKTVDGWELEFVGARKESYDRGSRKPVVENGSLEDDQNRRDFSINAMAIGLNTHNYGQLVDPFNGQADLQSKRIRTPLDPNITFSDDPLRMMRAIRFAAQLDFSIVAETMEGMITNAERISIVSQERISDELNKIVMAKKPSVGFKLLFDTGLLPLIFPEFCALQGVETKNGLSHKDNFYHTLQVLDNVAEESNNLWLRWSAILHDIAKPATKRFEDGHGWTFHGHEDKGARMVKGIFRKLRLPLGDNLKYVEKMVQLHLRPIVLSREEVTDSAIRRLIVDAGEEVDDLLTLCKADITSKNELKVKKYLRNLELVKQKIKDVTARDELRNWQPPLTGNDIMSVFIIENPPQIGELKNLIRESILDGVIPNERAAALTYMRLKGQEMGLKLK